MAARLRPTLDPLAKLNPSPEEKLLCLCARLDLAPSRRADLERLVAGPLNWDAVLRDASWHNLTPLVFHHLSGLENRGRIPASVMDGLKATYLANGARNLHLQTELQRVLDALGAQEVPAILLKGAALAGTVYGDICLRPMSDQDLLVPKDQLRVAQDTVRGLGYQSVGAPEEQEQTERHHRHLPGLFRDGMPALIEIHRHVVREDSGLYFDIAGFWSRAREASIAEKRVLVLAPEDLLIHLSLNFLLDRRFRSLAALRQLCDIAESIRFYQDSIQWELLISNLGRYRLAGPVGCVLYMARQLLDAPIPDEVAPRLWPRGLEEPQLERFVRWRVLGSRVWVARALIAPGSDYSPSRVALAALRRLAPSRSYMARLNGTSGLGWKGHLSYLTRIWGGFLILLGAVRRPGAIKEDLAADRWIHSLLRERWELS